MATKLMLTEEDLGDHQSHQDLISEYFDFITIHLKHVTIL